jgi:hypothetical protein
LFTVYPFPEDSERIEDTHRNLKLQIAKKEAGREIAR